MPNSRSPIDSTKSSVDSQLESIKEVAGRQMDSIKETAGRQVTRGIRKTRELKFYLAKFCLRLAIFLGCVGAYFYDKTLFTKVMVTPFWKGFSPYHVIWALFMVTMISHLIPNNRLTMAWQKARENYFRPDDSHSDVELMRYIQTQNIGAWRVMLVWMFFNAIFGVLYLVGIISASELFLLTTFYYLSDYICILFFCPFQTFIMKNKCCVNCRIYDWGHFMMFTPMLFIRNFYCWSLFFTSLVVLIHWELGYASHMERFWEGSNKTLRCENCKERTCAVKKMLAGISS